MADIDMGGWLSGRGDQIIGKVSQRRPRGQPTGALVGPIGCGGRGRKNDTMLVHFQRNKTASRDLVAELERAYWGDEILGDGLWDFGPDSGPETVPDLKLTR